MRRLLFSVGSGRAPGPLRPAPGGPGSVLLPLVVLQGLQAHVEVLTDPYGVPHIYAQNVHDLYFVTGYIQARSPLPDGRDPAPDKRDLSGTPR